MGEAVEAPTAAGATLPSGVQRVPIESLKPNPDQPRKIFTQEHLEELTASIRDKGVLQPILVRSQPGEDGVWQIIAGERRWRACGIAGVTEVPVRILDVDDRKVAELSLLENLQREDLNIMEEAKAYQGLISMGLTQTELAEKMGIMQEWRIQERLNLLKLSGTYQDCVVKGILSPSQAQEMSRVPKERQKFIFDCIRSGKASTYNKLRSLVNAMVMAGAQTSFLPEPTEKEKTVINKYDRMIERLTNYLNQAFNREDLSVLSKVLSGKSQVNMERIDLIIHHLNRIKKALLQSGSIQEVVMNQAKLGL